jgi:hypothetical protein
MPFDEQVCPVAIRKVQCLLRPVAVDSSAGLGFLVEFRNRWRLVTDSARTTTLIKELLR